jgi:hypothetical protein
MTEVVSRGERGTGGGLASSQRPEEGFIEAEQPNLFVCWMVKSAQRQEPKLPHMVSFAPLPWLVLIKGVPVTETPKMSG